MLSYVIRRLLGTVLVVVGVSVVVFFLVRLTGDPITLLLPPDATPEQIAVARSELLLDQPWPIQLGAFAVRAVQGDLGESIRFRQPALGLVLERFPATLLLTAGAMSVALLVAIPAAILGASRRNGPVETVVTLIALLGQSIPTFWLGLMLIMLFAVRWQFFPPSGSDGLISLVLPAVTLGAYSAAATTRILRSSLLEVLSQDYMRTARAKGLSERTTLFRHGLRNAAIPAVTVVGLQVGVLLGGAVVTEVLFAYPGIGRLAVQAISTRDFPLVQAFVILTGTLIATINLLVDITYGWLDPRIRYT